MEEAAMSEFNRAVSCTFIGKLWLLKIGFVGQFQPFRGAAQICGHEALYRGRKEHY
jgi:hypothetical protein